MVRRKFIKSLQKKNIRILMRMLKIWYWIHLNYNTLRDLMFCGPCIVIYLCDNNQHDALFYFQFISVINLYVFRAGLLLIIRKYSSVYTATGICHAFMLTGCWQDMNGTSWCWAVSLFETC